MAKNLPRTFEKSILYQHFIAVTSVYAKGQRISWHFSAEHTDLNVLREFMNAFKKVHGTMKLGIHRMSTNSTDWSSVTEKDLFFKDMVVTQVHPFFLAQQLKTTSISNNE